MYFFQYNASLANIFLNAKKFEMWFYRTISLYGKYHKNIDNMKKTFSNINKQIQI